MQWDFTPEELVRGEVGYDLGAFRHDLFAEIRANLATDDETFIRHSFDLIYDLCYWSATGRGLTDFVAALPENRPLDDAALHEIKEHMADNIMMLGAILQRMIANEVEQGLPLEQAIENVSQQHMTIISENGVLDGFV